MNAAREARRTGILIAAFGEICVKSFDRVRMEEIARRAGIGKSTIYEYFPSKEDLLSEVVIWVFEKLTVDLKKIFTADKPFREIVYEYIVYMRRLMNQTRNGFMMMQGDTTTFVEVHSHGETFRDFLAQSIADAAERAFARGEIVRKISTSAIVWLVICISSPITPVTEGEWETLIDEIMNVLFNVIDS